MRIDTTDIHRTCKGLQTLDTTKFIKKHSLRNWICDVINWRKKSY